ESLQALDPESVVGVVFSNELVDAFPVHRVRRERGAIKELYVDEQGDRLTEILGELSSPELAVQLTRLRDSGITLEEGQTAEVNIESLRWITDVARVLARGIVITTD